MEHKWYCKLVHIARCQMSVDKCAQINVYIKSLFASDIIHKHDVRYTVKRYVKLCYVKIMYGL